jgi:recombinational DNA repair ATPase RecF
MDDALLTAVLERLEQHKLKSEAEALLLAACSGESDLRRALGGEALLRPAPAPDALEHPALAYLASLDVTGFRGIGPTCNLTFAPGPGLTLVVGRNGSGKSSFAEAVELLLTGGVRRWGDRTLLQQGWRNLHHPAPSIRLALVVEGANRTTVERTWAVGQDLDSAVTTVQVAGEKRAGMERLGWDQALTAYRPFLAHTELEALLGRPSELYDLLVGVLGLDELTTTSNRLKGAAKAAEAPLEQAKKDLASLIQRLGLLDDDRATECEAALNKRTWDIDAAERVATGVTIASSSSQLETLRRLADVRAPAPGEVAAVVDLLHLAADALEAVAATQAGQARQLVGLLEAALVHHRHHGDGDCPVCGYSRALDSSWHERTRAAVEHLKAEAKAADEAHQSAEQAVVASNALLFPFPTALENYASGEAAVSAWRTWLAVPDGNEPAALRARADHFEGIVPALASAVEMVRQDAREKLAAQEDRWSPVASGVAAWCSAARTAQLAAKQVVPLKDASKWLTSAIDDLRNRRLRPLAEESASIWGQLRQESNVELGAIRLTGSATRRQVDFDVTVDGSKGAALSVMSQGEVNALALSVFLPRVTLPPSPFGFLMIDDPVQAMDPAKVEGLARVLSTTAAKRQVIVFTHDDRLPEAVRRLDLDVTILEVTRRPGSVVDVRQALDPPTRAIEDALAINSDPDVPEELARRVIAGQCRLALEAAFAEVFRRRHLASGDSHRAVENALLASSTSLTARAALALFGDPVRGGEVLSRLNSWGRWAADTYQACNKGAHGRYEHDLATLIRDTEHLVAKIRSNVT